MGANTLQNALFVYGVFIVYILISKPSWMFHDTGTIKQYGTGGDKSLLSFPVACVGGALIIYPWIYGRR